MPSGAAIAMPVTRPVPPSQVPSRASPIRSEDWCSSSHWVTSSGPRTDASTSNTPGAPVAVPASTAAAVARSAPGRPSGNVWYRRSRSTRNWRVSNSWWIVSRLHGTGVRSPGPAPIASAGRSRTSVVSWRLRSTLPRFSRSASPALPLTSSTRFTRFSSDPNSVIHFVAVFSPTPGMDGRLSLGSPRSAAKSGYWAGVRPYFSSRPAGS